MMKVNSTCSACGGKLVKHDGNIMQCENCQRVFYISKDNTRKIRITVPIARIIRSLLIGVGVMILIGFILFLLSPKGKTIISDTVAENSFGNQLSDIFREFATKAMDCSSEELKQEDLNQIQYLYLEYANDYYTFRYSFDDYYNFSSEEDFEKTVKEIKVCRFDKEIYLSDVKYFHGITRLEAYAGTWEQYQLASDNKIRAIFCNGSPYVKEEIPCFKKTNPDTLEEFQMKTCYGICTLEGVERMKNLRTLRANMYYQRVFIDLNKAKSVENLYLDDTEHVESFAEVGELTGLKNLEIDYINNRDITFLLQLENLETLTLDYCVYDASALEQILALPKLSSLSVQAGGLPNVTADEADALINTYGEKFVILY